MANKTAIEFFLYVHGDGSSLTLQVDCNVAPICYTGPSGSPIGPNFSVGSLLLSGFDELACSGGQTVTATHLLNIATFTLSEAIPSGTNVYIYGKMLF